MYTTSVNKKKNFIEKILKLKKLFFEPSLNTSIKQILNYSNLFILIQIYNDVKSNLM